MAKSGAESVRRDGEGSPFPIVTINLKMFATRSLAAKGMRMYSSSTSLNAKVAVLGAAGGIGKPKPISRACQDARSDSLLTPPPTPAPRAQASRSPCSVSAPARELDLQGCVPPPALGPDPQPTIRR